MSNRNTGILAMLASILLCGCPGLFLCVFGLALAFGGGTFSLNDRSGSIPPTYGFVFLCLSLILILIPVAAGFFALRNRPTAVPGNDEPLPPAS
jgi:membrane protein implicated in regulation of membrane protease activity